MIQCAASLGILLLLTICSVVSVTASDDKTKEPPDSTAKGKDIAVIETNLGTFEIELLWDDAPRTVENFAGLAKRKFFDGVKFHRIAKGSVIQGGDPRRATLPRTRPQHNTRCGHIFCGAQPDTAVVAICSR